MTKREVDQYVAEFERRFRERTPARQIDEVIANHRVGRGEMRTWFAATFGRSITVDDVLDLQRPLKACFKKLRAEFPSDVWEA